MVEPITKEQEIDLIKASPEIVKASSISLEGARYFWAQGRLRAVKIGSAWLANKAAFIKAVESRTIRRKPGRKPLW